MMIDDETLTLYFYDDGELSDADRAQVAAQLTSSPELEGHYAMLCAQLKALNDVTVTPAPSASFNETLHEALIDVAVPAERSSSRWLPWSMAATVLLAVLLLGVTQRAPNESPQVVQATPTIARGQPPITLRLVESHLLQSRLQLVSVESAGSDQRHALLDELIVRNRTIEASAQRAGDDDLARVLRAFEPVLLALQSDRSDDHRILLHQLNFELSAMLTKLDAPASDSAQSL
ncbi:MAG: hypothetical protein AB8G17_02625 [Gammaproteobacteria bacterium]